MYPKKSCDVEVSDEVDTSVEIRLRENPALKGSCKVSRGSSVSWIGNGRTFHFSSFLALYIWSTLEMLILFGPHYRRSEVLWASLDFESFSREAKGHDRAEARELAREGKRRMEAQMRMRQMIKEATAKKLHERIFDAFRFYAFYLGPPFALLILCVAIPPGSALAAALLASATVPSCCCLSVGVATEGWQEGTDVFYWGKYAFWVRFGFRLMGFLALALLVLLTIQHALKGFSWTAAIVWPVPLFWGGGCLVLGRFAANRTTEVGISHMETEVRESQREVSNRSIRFQGSVIRENGRPCVASWPGKYEGAWESLVSQGRQGDVSAAVVFLPEGTDDYGNCDSIPLAEGLPGTCWCTPLYGEKKPWGCRWFTKWRENIATAVESGAELEVYYFQNHVGKGKVQSFGTAGDDNLQREKVNKKQKDFEESPEFKQALHTGLGNLSKEPRGDGSSQYSREARRLFLASLPDTEREFLATSEGLGNSQKAEVAWLEKKGYAYWEVDVSTWLPGEGVERYVPLCGQREPQLHGRQDNFSPVSRSIARE